MLYFALNYYIGFERSSPTQEYERTFKWLDELACPEIFFKQVGELMGVKA
jgi:hypothetical protein